MEQLKAELIVLIQGCENVECIAFILGCMQEYTEYLDKEKGVK